MALSREERGMYARELMDEDKTLDFAVALSMVDEMEASGAFTPITNEQGTSTFDGFDEEGDDDEDDPYDDDIIDYSNPAPAYPPAEPMSDLPTFEFTEEDKAELPEFQFEENELPEFVFEEGEEPEDEKIVTNVPDVATLRAQYGDYYEDMTDEEVLADAANRTGSGAYQFTEEERAQLDAERDPGFNADGSVNYEDPHWKGKSETQMALEVGKKYLRDNVVKPISDFNEKQWQRTDTGIREGGPVTFQTRPQEQAAPQEGSAEAGWERNRVATKGLLHEMAIESMTDKILAGEPVNYEEELKKVTDDYRGDAREIATDVALTIATVMTGGLSGPVAAQRLIARYPKAAKYIIATMESAGIAGLSGISGNIAADRDVLEGVGTDVALGGAFGAGGQAVGDVYQGVKNIIKPNVRKTGEVAEEMVSETLTRETIRDELRSVNQLSEVAKDLKKGAENVNPEQLRNLDMLPDGPVKDNLKALQGGFSPRAQAKREEAVAFFKDKDNVARLEAEIGDVKYGVEQVQKSASSKYTALNTLMDQGAGGRMAIDTSYIDNTIAGKTGRLLEEQSGFGIPAAIRKSQFNKAQDKVRSKTIDELDDFLAIQKEKLAGPGLGRGERKGIRHQQDELRRVKDALESGKVIKESDVARGWEYLPESLKKSLDETMALQQYSKSFKGKKDDASVLVSKAPSWASHAALGVITGGAHWGKQLAAGVTIPALRALGQQGQKRVIKAANELVKKHDGNLLKIQEELAGMNAKEADYIMSALLFRLSNAEEDSEFLGALVDQWQE